MPWEALVVDGYAQAQFQYFVCTVVLAAAQGDNIQPY